MRIILRTQKSKTLGFLIVQTTIVPRYVAWDRARRGSFGKRPLYRTSRGTCPPDDSVHFRLFFGVYKRRRILPHVMVRLLNTRTVSHFWLLARCETSVDTCVNCATMVFPLSHFETTGKTSTGAKTMSDTSEVIYSIVDVDLVTAIHADNVPDMLKAVNEIQSILLRALTVNGLCRERYRLICELIYSVEVDCRDNPGKVSDDTLRDYDEVFRSFMLR